jgi:hypothetical protein
MLKRREGWEKVSEGAGLEAGWKHHGGPGEGRRVYCLCDVKGGCAGNTRGSGEWTTSRPKGGSEYCRRGKAEEVAVDMKGILRMRQTQLKAGMLQARKCRAVPPN